MQSEMRRPAIANIDNYVNALDERLRSQVGRTKRWVLPDAVRHPFRTLRSIMRPLIQSGAMVLTAFAVIIAVGAAPATVTPAQQDGVLQGPTVSAVLGTSMVAISEKIPAEDLLAVQEADIVDTPALTVE